MNFLVFASLSLMIGFVDSHSTMTCLNGQSESNCQAPARNYDRVLETTQYKINDSQQACQYPIGHRGAQLRSQFYGGGQGCGEASFSKPCSRGMGKVTAGQRITLHWDARNHVPHNPGNIELYMHPVQDSGQDPSVAQFKAKGAFCVIPYNSGCEGNMGNGPCRGSCTIPASANGMQTVWWYWPWKLPSNSHRTLETYATCADIMVEGGNGGGGNTGGGGGGGGGGGLAEGGKCTATSQCSAGLTCFEKNQYWSSCHRTCTPGLHDSDPPQYRTPWSCAPQGGSATGGGGGGRNSFAVHLNAQYSLVLDVAGGRNADGVNVQLWSNLGPGSAQKFSYTSSQQIQWVGTNKCLDVDGGKQDKGTNLQIWTCDSNNQNQKFQLNGAMIKWAGANLCLDAAGGGRAPGTNVHMWECNNNNQNQLWKQSPLTAGFEVPPIASFRNTKKEEVSFNITRGADEVPNFIGAPGFKVSFVPPTELFLVSPEEFASCERNATAPAVAQPFELPDMAAKGFRYLIADKDRCLEGAKVMVTIDPFLSSWTEKPAVGTGDDDRPERRGCAVACVAPKTCRFGTCSCREGLSGDDCSVASTLSNVQVQQYVGNTTANVAELEKGKDYLVSWESEGTISNVRILLIQSGGKHVYYISARTANDMTHDFRVPHHIPVGAYKLQVRVRNALKAESGDLTIKAGPASNCTNKACGHGECSESEWGLLCECRVGWDGDACDKPDDKTRSSKVVLKTKIKFEEYDDLMQGDVLASDLAVALNLDYEQVKVNKATKHADGTALVELSIDDAKASEALTAQLADANSPLSDSFFELAMGEAGTGGTEPPTPSTDTTKTTMSSSNRLSPAHLLALAPLLALFF